MSRTTARRGVALGLAAAGFALAAAACSCTPHEDAPDTGPLPGPTPTIAPTPTIESTPPIETVPARPENSGLTAAQAKLSQEIAKYEYLDVAFAGPPVDLTPPATIDLEYGSGHGGTLVLIRMSIGAETTSMERIAWQAYGRSPTTIGGKAERAEVPTSFVAPVTGLVRALSQAHVTARNRSSGSTSSADFFVLVRVCAVDPSADTTWEYAGYPSSWHEAAFVAPRLVVDAAGEILDAVAWTPVPKSDYPKTHVADAIRRNHRLNEERSHWWIRDRSTDALNWLQSR